MNNLHIYGTLGPSCHDIELLKQMFDLGMSGLRLNLSHVDLYDCKEWIDHIFQVNPNSELLIDMKGPELRLNKGFEPFEIHNDDIISIKDIQAPNIIYEYLNIGKQILIDDGKLLLEMIDQTNAKVIHGGLVKPSKSIAIKGIHIDSPTLTENDLMNLKYAKDMHVTGIMQPFVRNKQDLINLKNEMIKNNLDNCKIYAKIENLEGVNQLEELLPYCDEIIIARGDLGNATGLTRLPSIQHKIENICKENNKPYMVVTEMLNSMIENPTPTRAEVSDIYHAVYNGANSIMLTGETAAGKYPLEAMKYFVETAKYAYKDKMEN